MCHHHHNHEHTNERNSKIFVVGKLFLAIVFFVVAIYVCSPMLKLLLFLVAYVIAGFEVLYSAIKNVLKGEIFDENFLMSIATIGAFAIKEYPEAVMVMILYQIGEFLQDCAVEKSKKSISTLMNIRPDYANVEIGGEVIKKDPKDVHLGDIILVKAGEKIPLDGEIIEGEAVVDMSALTGESIPKTLKFGDMVISGAINTSGVIKIKVSKDFGESTVAKILDLVENASSKKAKTEKFITRFAKYYTPIVVLFAIILALVPTLFFGANINVWIERALIFLVISCPCALVISVPLSFFAGIGGASKLGILIKGSNYLEYLSHPDSVVFDKTGTLTSGVFSVTKVVPVGISNEELLEIAAYAEVYSNHPIAQSIKKAYGKDIDRCLISEEQELSGKGISVKVNQDVILVGNSKLLDDYSINYDSINAFGTIVYIARNNKYVGYIVISDTIKDGVVEAIKDLKTKVNNIVMLTGDIKSSADYIESQVGVDKVYSELLPNDKVEKLENMLANKVNSRESVLFVGDGINDAPVLARADVGIAMGALGSDAAIEAADVVIMDDKISKISSAISIAQKTMKIVKQNIIFAIGVKIIFLILGSLGFMSMWGAVFADVGVTLIAVLNSLRALKIPQ